MKLPILIVTLCGLFLAQPDPPHLKAETPPGSVQALNAFSKNLYLKLSKSETENVVVSPLGSYVLLALLHQGAAESTRKELETVGNFSDANFATLSKLLKQVDALPSLALAHRIYLDKSVSLKPEYRKKTAGFPEEAAQQVDISGNPERARKLINDWISQKTEGTIPQLIPELKSNGLSVLVSCLHFKGKWEHPFPKRATSRGTFWVSKDHPIMVAMMREKSAYFHHFSAGEGEGAMLPYSDPIDLVLLLPPAGVVPEAFLTTLDLNQLPSWPESPRETPLSIQLPRFEIASPSLTLTTVWKELGLGMTVEDPNLSAMLKVEPSTPLEMAAFHQAQIQVDEQGTTAAAATAAIISARGAVQVEQLSFDRPFLFFLRHRDSGAILLMGKVSHPPEFKAADNENVRNGRLPRASGGR